MDLAPILPMARRGRDERRGVYRLLFDANPRPSWVYEVASHRLVDANQAALDHYGWNYDLVVGARLEDVLPGEPTAVGERIVHQLAANGRACEMRVVIAPVMLGHAEARLVMAEEVTDAVVATDELTQETIDLATELREAQEMAHVGTWRWDIVADAVSWSDELFRMFGLSPGLTPATFEAYLARVHPEDREQVQSIIGGAVATPGSFDMEHRIVLDDGQVGWLRCRGRTVVDPDGRPLRMVGACQDVTEDTDSRADLKRLALHDPLTGLPNRTLFIDRLDQTLRGLERTGESLGVLFVDLDRFKTVNDTQGHAAGDDVLREVARRLETIVRPSDSIARFGGDEFAILCSGLTSPATAVELARRVLEAVAAPIQAGTQRILTNASIGIAMADDASTLPESVLRDADSAMYDAKASGRGRFVVFDHRSREAAERRVRKADALGLALQRNELRVYFQPDIDLGTESAVGVEALVRWQHPELGLLPPAEFIGIAEESGLILPLGSWVLEEACRQVAQWPDAPGGSPWLLSVNLSARQLTEASLIDTVLRVLAETGIEPHRLCLEITESVLMDDVETAIEALLGLRSIGVRVAIDDFGTGYSSLSYLRRFPVDVVKIDHSFVAGLGLDPAADAIVGAVVNLSHALGFEVVAEGIESEEQLVAVRGLHCDRAQGHLWSAPVGAHELERWATASQEASPAEPLDLRVLLAERTTALRDATGRPVVLQAPPNLGSAIAGEGAVRTVVDHLLGNAVTYSGSESPIVVSAASDRRWVRVSVADFGIGMNTDEAARCFEQFWQAGGPSPASQRGTGIGLYIVRSLVEAMGGHVSVRSATGKGSTFTFALPRSHRSSSRHAVAGGVTPGIGADSSIREFMRQIGVPNRRGA